MAIGHASKPTSLCFILCYHFFWALLQKRYQAHLLLVSPRSFSSFYKRMALCPYCSWVFEASFDDLMEIGNGSWLSRATEGDSLGKHPGFCRELSMDHIMDEAADWSMDQHPRWVPITEESQLVNQKSESCLAQVLAKLAPWNSFKKKIPVIFVRGRTPKMWSVTWEQEPGEKPESLPQHCPFSGGFVLLAGIPWDSVREALCAWSGVAGAHHCSEVLPQAAHFVVGSSFLPGGYKMPRSYSSWSPSLSKCQPLSSCLSSVTPLAWCPMEKPKPRLLPAKSRQTRIGLFWVFPLEREFVWLLLLSFKAWENALKQLEQKLQASLSFMSGVCFIFSHDVWNSHVIDDLECLTLNFLIWKISNIQKKVEEKKSRVVC